MPFDISRLSSGVALPKEVASEILGVVTSTSAIATASKNIALPGNGATVPVITGNAVADWVGETDQIKTSKTGFAKKDMSAYKLGVIVPFSREFVRDAASLYDAAVQYLPSALATKIDQTVAGATAPGSNFAVLGAATAKVVDGTATGQDLIDIIVALADMDVEASAFIAAPKLHAKMLTAPTSTTDSRPLFAPAMNSQSVGSIFGADVFRVHSNLVTGTPNTIGLVGDFANRAVFGTVNGVELKVADQATISDGAAGTINLFASDMIAVRATIEVGFQVEDVNKFLKVTDA